MEGGIQGVDHEATLQREGHEGHTLVHPRGVVPIPVLDLGLIPKKCPDPVPDLPLGTGRHHYQMTETSRGAGHPLGHHLGDVLFHQTLAMEVLVVPILLSPCNDLPGKALLLLNQLILHCVRKQAILSHILVVTWCFSLTCVVHYIMLTVIPSIN